MAVPIREAMDGPLLEKFLDFEQARLLQFRTKYDSANALFTTLGGSIISDLKENNYALLRVPQSVAEMLEEAMGGEADAASGSTTGKVVVTLPSPLCEMGLDFLRDEVLKSHGTSATQVELAGRLHKILSLTASALLAAHAEERWRMTEEVLLTPSADYPSVLRAHTYFSSRKRAKVDVKADEAHEDRGLLTLVACHNSDAGGALEVLSPCGIWQTVPLAPGVVAVLPGLALQAYTQNSIPASMHRVRLPSKSGGLRRSVSFHLMPNPSANCGGKRMQTYLEKWAAERQSINTTSEKVNMASLVAAARAQEAEECITIHLKKISGMTITVRIISCSIGLQLKRVVRSETGIFVTQIFIIWQGAKLQDGETLRSRGVTDGSELSLVLKLRGD